MTVCVDDRERVLGEIADGIMTTNDPGRMVQTVWEEIPLRYPDVVIDAFVVMPNHIPAVVMLSPGVEATPSGCPSAGQAQRPAPTSLPDVVHRFKSLTTARYRSGVQQSGWKPFGQKLWQRNYYEHVIRGQEELNRIRQYILDNPARCADDKENPDNWKTHDSHRGSKL